jgi:hypothetical protein
LGVPNARSRAPTANCATCAARNWKKRSTRVARESSATATRSIGR